MTTAIEFALAKLAACVLLWEVLILLALASCASAPSRALPDPVTGCTSEVRGYHVTPDGHKWYLDCVNQLP
jgi:hypothetical protein